MKNALLISTTFEHLKEAEEMADLLLEARLIACAQITGPITSCYWWNGKIEKSMEYLLAMKSIEHLYKDLEREIIDKHSYETPEIIAVPITHASKEYLNWMQQELSL